MLCYGCIYAAYEADNRCLCPFCRTAETTSEEDMERLKKRVDGGDAVAICQLGSYYLRGEMGLPQDHGKAVELWHRAGELGSAAACYDVGIVYNNGEGVERDMKKANYYWELAAMGGHVVARHNLGCTEGQAGNMNRAVKHYMISAGAGYNDSLHNIRQFFLNGRATKDDFERALRAHKEANDDMKSDQRDAAAAALALSNFHSRRHE
jgi:TPR repeat protein